MSQIRGIACPDVQVSYVSINLVDRAYLPVRRTVQEAPLLGEGYADPVPKKVNSQEDMFLLAAREAPQMRKNIVELSTKFRHHDKTLQKDCLSR